MAVLAKPEIALNLEQSYQILSQLSLLNSAQHKDSKLIFYPTEVWLETSSASWRSLAAWGSSWVGYEVSRDLSELAKIVRKVHVCMTSDAVNFEKYETIKKGIPAIEAAEKGLDTLRLNQYTKDPKKEALINSALTIIRETKTFYSDKNQGFLDRSKHVSASRREGSEQTFREVAERLDRENRELKAALVKMGEELAKLQQQNALAGQPLNTISTQQIADTIKRLTLELGSREREPTKRAL